MTNQNTPPTGPPGYFNATKLREQVLDVIERAMGERFDIGHIGDVILATFEVRPRGRATDAEVEAALAVLRSETPGKRSQFDCVRAALEAARDVRPRMTVPAEQIKEHYEGKEQGE